MNSKLPDWRKMTLDEVCSGNLQTGPFGSQLKAEQYCEEGIPVFMPKDLLSNRAVKTSAAKIPSEIATALKKHRVIEGDILFSRRGDVARYALIDKEASNGICGTGCLRARPDSTYDSLFISYALQQDTIKDWLTDNAVGQTMLNLNTTILSALPLDIPPRAEQTKIARILSTWDKAITTTERLLANSQQQKQALMQQLLTGKKRLSGFSQKWSQAPVSSCLLGSALRNSHYLLGLEDVMSVNNTAGMIPMREQTIGKSIERYKIVKPGWFAYNPMRINVGSICRWNGKSDCLVSPDYVVFQCDEGALLGSYFDQYRKSEPWASHMDNAGNGSVRVRIYLNDLAQLEIPLPPLPEQQKIAQVLATADAEITNLQAQLAKLRLEKKALMQQLLTGQRRVRLDAEAAA